VPIWKEPHWSEGMLLLPQHLQVAQRHADAQMAAAWDHAAPFAWGFAALEIPEPAIRNGVVGVARCRLRTPEGTWVVVPDNTEVAERPFEEELDKSPDGMLVHLAVPRLHEVRPNASYEPVIDGQPTRYLIEPLERKDENSGDNPQQIEVRSFQGRLLLGGEAQLPNFESVPIARLFRSGEEGGAPRLDVSFIPPLLRIGASPELMSWLKLVLNDLGARNKELAAEVAKREMNFRSGVEDHLERLLMLHVLNQGLAWLRQLLAVDDTRPHVAYAELCRLAGQLSVFSGERRVLEYPTYDHRKLGEIFKLVCEHVRALLQPFGPGVIRWRDFGPRETGTGLQVQLEPDWLTDRCEMYVGVHCGTLDEHELDRLLRSLDWKIAALEDVDTRFTGGLPGLELRPIRTATGLLPASKEIKYYQVMRDAELWPRVKESRLLAVRYSPAGQAKLEGVSFRVYVVMSTR